MNITELLRYRQNGVRNNRIRQKGIDKELKTLKATLDDCARINGESLPAAIEFHPNTPELLIADDRGTVSIVNSYEQRSDKRLAHEWRAHRNAIFAARWTYDGSKILVASADYTVTLWKNAKLERTFQPKNAAIRCIAPHPANSEVFIGGGRDCDLSIFDSRQKKVQAITNRVLPYRHVEYVHFPGKCPELRRKSSLGAQHRSILIKKQDKVVSSVTFLNENEIVSCGIYDHTIKLWDLRKFRDYKDAKLTLSSPTNRGFTSLAAYNNCVFASCMDGSVYEYGLHIDYENKPRRAYQGHTCEGSGSIHLKLDLNPTLGKLAIGSSDGNARIYPIHPYPHDKKENADSEIIIKDGLSIGRGAEPTLYCAWNKKTNALALASDDLVVAIYKSDFDELSYFDRREIEKEKIYGSAKIGETQIISTQKAKKTTESYSASETLKEMNKRFGDLGFSDPTRLCPWRKFAKKRKLEHCSEENIIKNPRPAKRIVLQSKNVRVGSPNRSSGSPKLQTRKRLLVVPQQSSITKFFSPKPK